MADNLEPRITRLEDILATNPQINTPRLGKSRELFRQRRSHGLRGTKSKSISPYAHRRASVPREPDSRTAHLRQSALR